MLKIKHGVAQSDRTHFDPKVLAKYPKIADWLEDPGDSQYSERFNNMTTAQFDAYKARKNGSAKVKALLSRESGPSKKKARAVNDDDSEAEVQAVSKKLKGKRKAKAVVDSSDLDSDSDD